MHVKSFVASDAASSSGGSAPRRRCIFTSVGDRGNVTTWLGSPDRSWDLITCYYGDDSEAASRIAAVSDRHFRRKGSKFQNLHALHHADRSLLAPYEQVWVMDDDLLISPPDIERMFRIAEYWDLWVSQPAFDPRGKIAHPVTRPADESGQLRITSFVEVTCPLFRRDRLVHFLDEHYDGSLTGFGIDHWFGHALGADRYAKFAVVDALRVLNPLDSSKGGVREINRLQKTAERRRAWEAVRDAKGITQAKLRTLAVVKCGFSKHLTQRQEKAAG